MVYINEWLPNPVGNDNAGEFIELYNSASASANLNGYSLGDGTKKKFSLSAYSIAANGYLLLKKAQTKLALKNTNGSLWLYGLDGQVIDHASFKDAAPEGKSYSRVDYSDAPIGHFAFLYPTPGEKNQAYDATVTTRNYPTGISLSRQLSPASFLTILITIPFFLLLFFIYVTRANGNISNFFFKRDEEIGV